MRKARPLDVIVPFNQARDESVIKVLENVLARARKGEVVGVGVVVELRGGQWFTDISKCPDRRVFAAMLIELGMKRLGFKDE
jgi:hypothetical protein